MRNFRIILLILLTGMIVAAFAGLPSMVGSWQDRSEASRSGSELLQRITLDLHDENETMPILKKLAMLDDVEVISINSTEITAMTEEEVYLAAQMQMAAYEEAGIFQWFPVDLCWAQLKLGFDPEDATNYVVFWTVGYSSQDRRLLLDIDDETGKILTICYDVYGTYDSNNLWERNRKIMDSFTDIYFSQLGLTEMAEAAESIPACYEYCERDGDVSNAIYQFGDALYGEIDMEFYVTAPGGFSLVLPN